MTVVRIRPCPHCKKPTQWEGNPWRPFCSKRCRTIDLGGWASGEYRIPGSPLPVESDESPVTRDDGEEEAK